VAGQGFCPPGLAKKGCVPPGQRKFHHGDRIPYDLHYDYLDYRRYGLPHPKHGHRYIRIGEDAYLIAEGTQRVIEAINLFDAASA
jgi:Ni/Co efflux regulator RcnB